MNPHPRLYIGKAAHARLQSPPTLPYVQAAAQQVAEGAAHYAALPPLTYDRHTHNALLVRAREVQTRVVTLLTRWQQTGESQYRDAVIACVRQMGAWDYWSWIAQRAGDAAPDAIFDLSYGENCATLALAYDWLFDTLTADEAALFLDVAERPLLAGRKHAHPEGAWWFGKPDSNWNTVCAGGLGMLVLAMYEAIPDAANLLAQVETSIAPFLHHLDTTQGAWPEGIGYWNYGMRYAFMVLLSHEAATGRPHPLLALDGVRQTLSFPLDFCPQGVPCSFGDVNRWFPLPFHYAAAQRLDCAPVCQALDAYLLDLGLPASTTWPNAAEWLLLHPGKACVLPSNTQPAQKPDGVKLYTGLDWAVLADHKMSPPLTMTLRGGTTDVPHGHRDLLSFHCVVGGEAIITNLSPAEYLDTTFSPRREEIFEITPASKNTILINGVGITSGSALDSTEVVRIPAASDGYDIAGIRLVATTAMGEMRDGPAAHFCGRVVFLFAGQGLLIVDRVHLPHPGRVESRVHTFADVELDTHIAVLRGMRNALSVTYAADIPALLRAATTAPTTPTEPSATVLRWCTEARSCTDVALATWLAVGAQPASVALAADGDALHITLTHGDWTQTLTLTRDLRTM